MTAAENPLVPLLTAVQELADGYQKQDLKIEQLEESLSQRLTAFEDQGWSELTGHQRGDDLGLSLDDLHKITPKLRDMASLNPLHIRGAQLRHSYVFGRGINFTGLDEKFTARLRKPYVKASVFSVQAYEVMNLALFTDGNFFVIRDTNDKFVVVPLSQITGEVTDPDDSASVRYFKRSWPSDRPDGKPNERWYPVARYKNSLGGRGKTAKKINKTITVNGHSVSVAQDAVIYHHTTKRQAGWTYGLPDSLGAYVWSLAYSEYLTDSSLLVKALQKIAWAISSATKAGQTNVAAQVARPGVGGIAAMGEGNQLSGVGVPSAQVNFGNGQPLAAMAATSMGVPVIALLSSPGATGGSYGAATTLDEPTLKGMRSLQDSWGLFFDELLRDMGAAEPAVEFPSIESDPTYREVASIIQAHASGAINQTEMRNAVLDVLDVQKTTNSLPKADGFNAYVDPTLAQKQVDAAAAAAQAGPSGQGKSGDVEGGTNQGDNDPDAQAERDAENK